MFSPTRRPWRLALMAPLLLLLLLSPSQPQAALAYNPRTTSHPEDNEPGLLIFWLWSDVLYHNESQTFRAMTPPMAEYSLWMYKMVFREPFYSFETIAGGFNNGGFYQECGYFVRWDIDILVTDPPECVVHFAIRKNLMPGICWGHLGGFPFIQLSDPEAWQSPGSMHTSLVIGEEVFRELHHESLYVDGSVYIYLKFISFFGNQCEHHAFRTIYDP